MADCFEQVDLKSQKTLKPKTEHRFRPIRALAMIIGCIKRFLTAPALMITNAKTARQTRLAVFFWRGQKILKQALHLILALSLCLTTPAVYGDSLNDGRLTEQAYLEHLEAYDYFDFIEPGSKVEKDLEDVFRAMEEQKRYGEAHVEQARVMHYQLVSEAYRDKRYETAAQFKHDVDKDLYDLRNEWGHAQLMFIDGELVTKFRPANSQLVYLSYEQSQAEAVEKGVNDLYAARQNVEAGTSRTDFVRGRHLVLIKFTEDHRHYETNVHRRPEGRWQRFKSYWRSIYKKPSAKDWGLGLLAGGSQFGIGMLTSSTAAATSDMPMSYDIAFLNFLFGTVIGSYFNTYMNWRKMKGFDNEPRWRTRVRQAFKQSLISASFAMLLVSYRSFTVGAPTNMYEVQSSAAVILSYGAMAAIFSIGLNIMLNNLLKVESEQILMMRDDARAYAKEKGNGEYRLPFPWLKKVEVEEGVEKWRIRRATLPKKWFESQLIINNIVNYFKNFDLVKGGKDYNVTINGVEIPFSTLLLAIMIPVVRNFNILVGKIFYPEQLDRLLTKKEREKLKNREERKLREIPGRIALRAIKATTAVGSVVTNPHGKIKAAIDRKKHIRTTRKAAKAKENEHLRSLPDSTKAFYLHNGNVNSCAFVFSN